MHGFYKVIGVGSEFWYGWAMCPVDASLKASAEGVTRVTYIQRMTYGPYLGPDIEPTN